jgi:hypothetical protein
LSRPSLIHGLAAAAIAAVALAPGVASAKPVLGIIIKPKPVLGIVIKPPPKPILGVVIPPKPITGIVIHPPHPHPIWGGGGWYGPPVVWWHHHHEPGLIVEGGPTRFVSAPMASTPSVANAPCTCLTKQYLGDGSVLFKDVCTKEAAVATADELKAQAQHAGP